MPIQIENLSPPQSSPIVGIDLGTTHSLVALVRDGVPQVLKTREGHRLLPSIVSFVGDSPVVGYEAKHKKVQDAQETLFSVKRLLGRSIADLKDSDEQLPYEVFQERGQMLVRAGSHVYTPIQVSALILKELKASAEKALGCEVSRAVITVPAYFNDAQRQATRTAGRLAGFDVLRMINEPTAASLAYGLDRKKQGLIAVYDLGGGTFDVSILKLQDGVFEVLATHGDTHLGGDDMDHCIAQAALADIQANYPLKEVSPELQAALLEAAEKLKISLSQKPEGIFRVQIESLNQTYEKVWTLEEFEGIVRSLVEKTELPCLQALKDAGLRREDLSDVVLVGGPTRLRLVQEIARTLFGREPNTSLHPDEVVAEGAAIQADILAGNNRDLLLLDVVPLSLGLETYGGVMSPLIARNTRIPTVMREVFTTFVDNQTGVDIHILQGERDQADENRSLAKFKLSPIQPMPAGMPRVEVTFLIDADGILQVAAKDLKTGNEQAIEVRPSFGLTDEEVERMLAAGIEKASEDQAFRQKVKIKNDAEALLNAVDKQLPQALQVLSVAETQVIQEAATHLRAVLLTDDALKIREASAHLNHASTRFAELLIKEELNHPTKGS